MRGAALPPSLAPSHPASPSPTLVPSTRHRTHPQASAPPTQAAAAAAAAARRRRQRLARPWHAACKRLATPGAAADDGAGSAVTPEDEVFMRRALELARRGEGQTHPNPAVGCVIVDAAGAVVGEGYHPRAGLPHAEVYALRAAGQAAAGGTAYVTLEPCNHHGRTPPCSRALVAARVARVVVGCSDPNPLVGGQGIRTLRDAGIQVAVGCEEQACFSLNADFMKRMQAEAAAAAAGA